MKKLIILVAIGIAIAVGLKFGNQAFVEKRAEARVQTMMEGWLAGGTTANGYAQEAVCMWFNGKKFPPDNETLAAASTAFDNWRKEKGLYRKINNYSIERVESPKGSPSGVVHVFVRIDGKTYGMRLARSQSVEWTR